MRTTIQIGFIFSLIALAGSCSSKSDTEDVASELPFLKDYTPRFEEAGSSAQRNSDATKLFYMDKGILFSSSKYKTGYASRDGSSFYFVEWSGGLSVGEKSNPSLRTQSGEVPLAYVKIHKAEGGIIWLTYKQSENSSEGIIVQKW